MENEPIQDLDIIDSESSGSGAKSESPSNSTSSNDYDDLSPTDSASCKPPAGQHQRKVTSPRAATMDSGLSIGPNGDIDGMLVKATSPGSPVIDLDISSWEPTIQAKVKEYSAARGKLSSQKYRIPCDHSTFISGFADVKIPGAKIEYIVGSAEVIVFSASYIHNGIGEINWENWVRRLPEHPDLHTHEDAPGLECLIEKYSDVGTPFQSGEENEKRLTMAPDVHLFPFFDTGPKNKGIIIEVAYSESLKHAKEKMLKYLWDSDPPRPSVVILFNYEKRNSREDYQDIELKFEVYRRSPFGDRQVQLHETGLAWPRHKALALENPQSIRFSLEEIFVAPAIIEKVISMRNGLEEAGSEYLRLTLSGLQDGLLELLRSKISDNESIELPIKYVTNKVERALMTQSASEQPPERDSVASII